MGPLTWEDGWFCSGEGCEIAVEFIQCIRRRFPKGWQKGSFI